MKRITILLSIVVAFCQNTFCAEQPENVQLSDSAIIHNRLSNPHWTIQFSYQIMAPYHASNGIHSIDAFSCRIGWDIGASYYKPLTRHWFLEPGLLLYYHRLDIYSDLYNRYLSNGHIDLLSIQVPLNFGYAWQWKNNLFGIHTGPLIDVSLFGKEIAGFANGWGNSINRSAFNKFERLNIMWNIGVSASGRHFGYGFDWAYGMNDFAKDRHIKAHNIRYRFSLSYKF